MRLSTIRTQEDLIRAVRGFGFLPFFSGPIPGFSIDDAVPLEVWATNQGLGPWMWRDEIAHEGNCIYGKFFAGKTGYVSREWFAHFANYRRDGYDFDARYDEGLARFEDKQIYDLILTNGPISAPALRRLAGAEKGKTSRFEASMTRLQMMAYVVPCDFLFPRSTTGEKKYSYGITVFDIPERWLGEEVVRGEYKTDPKVSHQAVLEHLHMVLPAANEKDILKMIGA